MKMYTSRVDAMMECSRDERVVSIILFDSDVDNPDRKVAERLCVIIPKNRTAIIEVEHKNGSTFETELNKHVMHGQLV